MQDSEFTIKNKFVVYTILYPTLYTSYISVLLLILYANAVEICNAKNRPSINLMYFVIICSCCVYSHRYVCCCWCQLFNVVYYLQKHVLLCL